MTTTNVNRIASTGSSTHFVAFPGGEPVPEGTKYAWAEEIVGECTIWSQVKTVDGREFLEEKWTIPCDDSSDVKNGERVVTCTLPSGNRYSVVARSWGPVLERFTSVHVRPVDINGKLRLQFYYARTSSGPGTIDLGCEIPDLFEEMEPAAVAS